MVDGWLWIGVGMLLSSCAADKENDPPILPGTAEPSCDLAWESYDIDSIEIPRSEVAKDIGFDLDGDEHNITENALTFVVNRYRDQVEGFPAAGIELALSTGALAWRVDLAECRDGSGDEVRVRLYSDTGLPTLPAVGEARDNVLFAELGNGVIPITSMFAWEESDEPVVWLSTYATVAEIERVNDLVIAGRIGLAFERDPAFEVAAPVVVRAYNRVIQASGCSSVVDCPKGSEAYALLDLYDEDFDGSITMAEFERNDLAEFVTQPDVDLLDQSGSEPVFWPRHDEVKESMSFAFHFTAITGSAP